LKHIKSPERTKVVLRERWHHLKKALMAVQHESGWTHVKPQACSELRNCITLTAAVHKRVAEIASVPQQVIGRSRNSTRPLQQQEQSVRVVIIKWNHRCEEHGWM
jgi:hypothetical protein